VIAQSKTVILGNFSRLWWVGFSSLNFHVRSAVRHFFLNPPGENCIYPEITGKDMTNSGEPTVPLGTRGSPFFALLYNALFRFSVTLSPMEHGTLVKHVRNSVEANSSGTPNLNSRSQLQSSLGEWQSGLPETTPLICSLRSRLSEWILIGQCTACSDLLLHTLI
jgi:hypothetical protein